MKKSDSNAKMSQAKGAVQKPVAVGSSRKTSGANSTPLGTPRGVGMERGGVDGVNRGRLASVPISGKPHVTVGVVSGGVQGWSTFISKINSLPNQFS